MGFGQRMKAKKDNMRSHAIERIQSIAYWQLLPSVFISHGARLLDNVLVILCM
jgi:hypothetical protein